MPNDLIALIKQKQDAVAKLEAELAEARAMLLKAPSRQEAYPRTREIGGPQPKKKGANRREPNHRVGAPGILSTSSVGLTVDVLRQAGKPLHITDIIRGIEAKGHEVSKTTLIGNLSRYVQKERVFYRAGPNVFGLLEMRKG